MQWFIVRSERLFSLEDISRSSMRIHIRHSKARSDRYAILSQNALDILTQYWFLGNTSHLVKRAYCISRAIRSEMYINRSGI